MFAESSAAGDIRSDVEHRRLLPVFLLAATINAEGNIDLDAPDGDVVGAYARAEFSLGREGELFQQRYWIRPPRPYEAPAVIRRGERGLLDMVFLAECLTITLRDLTPSLFRLTESTPRGPRRFLSGGEQSDYARQRLLHDAFSMYLLAYEEHLV